MPDQNTRLDLFAYDPVRPPAGPLDLQAEGNRYGELPNEQFWEAFKDPRRLDILRRQIAGPPPRSSPVYGSIRPASGTLMPPASFGGLPQIPSGTQMTVNNPTALAKALRSY